MSYTITEPHPTVPANSYIHAGRGGLGNTFRAPVTTPSYGVPTALTKVSSSASAGSASSTTRFYAGRGGAGNVHPVSERRELSLDDEYAHAAAIARATTSGHVGRGGAGNVFFLHKKSAADAEKKAEMKAEKKKLKLQNQHAQHAQHAQSTARKGSDASSCSSGSSTSSVREHSRFWSRFH